MGEPRRVVVGRITRAHALAGGVRVEPEGPAVDGLSPGDRVEVVDRDGSVRELTVTERAGHAARPILRFREICDRTAAEALRGGLLRVAVDAIADRLEDDTYLVGDLVGCAVFVGDRELGRVVDVHPGTANDNLEVQGTEGTQLLPFTRDAVIRLALAEGRIEIRPDLLPRKAPRAD